MGEEPEPPSDTAAGFVIRLDRCIGCWACAIACRMENSLTEGEWWISIETIRESATGDEAGVTSHYEPSIGHCARLLHEPVGSAPPCVPACPTTSLVWGDLADPSSVAGALASRQEATLGEPPTGTPVSVQYLPSRASPQRRSGVPAPPP
jgi:Fe-S-cluster-containing dehydrogenase component